MNIMFLVGKAVLRVIDKATRFSSATFLDSHGAEFGQSFDGTWLACVMNWCLL